MAMKDQEVRTTFFITQLACSKPRKRERSPPAVPRQPAPNQPRNQQQQPNKGKGKAKGGKGKGKGARNDGGGTNASTADTTAVNTAKRTEVLLVAVPASGKMICIKYNKNTCIGGGCNFEHACLRCGEHGHRLSQCPKPPNYR